MILRPKNWNNFQHYKNRNPPWIKLHKALLDDYEFYTLPVASKALAPLLWLLASESLDGEICADLAKISFRLRLTENEFLSALKPLVDNGFIEDASNVLAERKQSATPETEKETEKEAEKNAPVGASDKVRKPRRRVQLDLGLTPEESRVFEAIWQVWPTDREGKIPRGKKFEAADAFKALLESGATLAEIEEIGLSYPDHPKARDGYVQNVSTFFGERGWCREGIIRLRAQRKEAIEHAEAVING